MASKKGNQPTTEADRLAARKEKLTSVANRACSVLHDGGNNVAKALALAARAGMPREQADTVLEAIRATVADVEAVVEHAYAPSAGPAPTTRGRVDLGSE